MLSPKDITLERINLFEVAKPKGNQSNNQSPLGQVHEFAISDTKNLIWKNKKNIRQFLEELSTYIWNLKQFLSKGLKFVSKDYVIDHKISKKLFTNLLNKDLADPKTLQNIEELLVFSNINNLAKIVIQSLKNLYPCINMKEQISLIGFQKLSLALQLISFMRVLEQLFCVKTLEEQKLINCLNSDDLHQWKQFINKKDEIFTKLFIKNDKVTDFLSKVEAMMKQNKLQIQFGTLIVKIQIQKLYLIKKYTSNQLNKKTLADFKKKYEDKNDAQFLLKEIANTNKIINQYFTHTPELNGFIEKNQFLKKSGIFEEIGSLIRFCCRFKYDETSQENMKSIKKLEEITIEGSYWIIYKWFKCIKKQLNKWVFYATFITLNEKKIMPYYKPVIQLFGQKIKLRNGEFHVYYSTIGSRIQYQFKHKLFLNLCSDVKYILSTMISNSWECFQQDTKNQNNSKQQECEKYISTSKNTLKKLLCEYINKVEAIDQLYENKIKKIKGQLPKESKEWYNYRDQINLICSQKIETDLHLERQWARHNLEKQESKLIGNRVTPKDLQQFQTIQILKLFLKIHVTPQNNETILKYFQCSEEKCALSERDYWGYFFINSLLLTKQSEISDFQQRITNIKHLKNRGLFDKLIKINHYNQMEEDTWGKLKKIEDMVHQKSYLIALSLLQILNQEEKKCLKQQSALFPLSKDIFVIQSEYEKWMIKNNIDFIHLRGDYEFEDQLKKAMNSQMSNLIVQNLSEIVLCVQAVKISYFKSHRDLIQKSEVQWKKVNNNEDKAINIFAQFQTRCIKDSEYFRYMIKLGNIQNERYQGIDNKFKDLKFIHKYVHIDRINFDQTQKKMYLEFRKSFNQETDTLKNIMKQLILKYDGFRSKFQNDFPYWHLFFTTKTLKIQKVGENQFKLDINPLQALITSMFLSKQIFQKKVEDRYSKYPFIYLSLLIEKQSKQNLQNWCANICQRKEFENMLAEMRALDIDLQGESTAETFYDCPYFWSLHQKIIETITFKEILQNQVNIQESRIKKNEHHYKILMQEKQRLEKDQERTKDEKKLQEIIQKLQNIQNFRAPIPLQKQQGTYESTEQTEDRRARKKITQTTKIQQIQYDFADRFQRSTKCFYSIEGILESCAFKQNIGNIKNDYQESIQDPYQYGAYKWQTSKDQLIDMINRVKTKEEIKYQQKIKHLWRLTYPSFQAQIRSVRNVFVHNIYDPILKKPISFEQKIECIQECFPKIFIFIHKWKNIVGKPLFGNKNYSFANYHEVKNQNSIRNQIYKILRKAFPQNMKNQESLERVKHLTRIIKEYSSNPNYDKKPNQIFGNFERIENEKDEYEMKIKYDCVPCYILSKIQYKDYRSIWGFLNNVRQNKFNFLFWEHRISEDTRICRWALQDRVQYNFFNLIHRSKIRTPEQEAQLEDELFKYDNFIQQAPIQTSSDEQKDDKTLSKSRTKNCSTPVKQKKMEEEAKDLENRPKKGWTIKQFEKLSQKERKQYYERLKITDYLSNLFVHELLTAFPTLLEDIRYTQWQWDRNLKMGIEIPKRCWE